jgi:hypothetical protein
MTSLKIIVIDYTLYTSLNLDITGSTPILLHMINVLFFVIDLRKK